MEMHSQVDIAAPAAKVWEVVGQQFGEIGEWATILRASSLRGELGVGATRICDLGGSRSATERITEFSPDAMVLAYAITSGMPPGMRAASNHWTIEAISATRCRVRTRATVAFSWWMRPLVPLWFLALKLAGQRVFEELKYRVEQGRPHPRKAAAAKGLAGPRSAGM